MKEIRFFAMMRSGQHAIINWLLAQLPEHSFVNDPLHPINWIHGKAKFSKPDDLFLVYNVEDRFILSGIKECEEKLYDHSEERDGEIINVLILRDPFNMFASRYSRETNRKKLTTGEKQHEEIMECSWSPLEGWTSKKAVECWKSHAKEIASPTVINLIINYNQWVLNEDYRQSLAKFFGVEFNDVNYNIQAVVQGEGSSFRKNDSKVLKRCKKYIYDSHFMSLFDEETIELAQGIFGWNILQ